MCDVWQRHDVVNKVNGETIEFKPDMRLPRIDPVEVCMIVWYLLLHNESSEKCVETETELKCNLKSIQYGITNTQDFRVVFC